MRRRTLSARPIAGVLTGLLAIGALVAGPKILALAAGGPNLAAGKPVAASSTNSPYTATNLNDGDPATYWESANNAFPQWAQVDLGSSTSIDQLVLKLPPAWGVRTETLSIQGSTNGSSFTDIVGSTGYVFDPAASNVVTVNFAATSTRFVRLNITANTGWPAGQISELEVHGAGSSPNLALGHTMTASGVAQTYVAANANDGNRAARPASECAGMTRSARTTPPSTIPSLMRVPPMSQARSLMARPRRCLRLPLWLDLPPSERAPKTRAAQSSDSHDPHWPARTRQNRVSRHQYWPLDARYAPGGSAMIRASDVRHGSGVLRP